MKKYYTVSLLRLPFEGKKCETLKEAMEFPMHMLKQFKSSVEVSWAVIEPDKFWVGIVPGQKVTKNPWVIEYNDSTVMYNPDKSEYGKLGADIDMNILEAIEIEGKHGSVWVYLLKEDENYVGGWSGFDPRTNREFYTETRDSELAREDIMRLAKEKADVPV